MLCGDANQAAVIFARTAIAQEKAFPVPKNFDPPPWWYPVRRSLAAAQLKAGRYAEAERAAHASLADWPQDALALRILSEAEARQGRRGAARDHRADFNAIRSLHSSADHDGMFERPRLHACDFNFRALKFLVCRKPRCAQDDDDKKETPTIPHGYWRSSRLWPTLRFRF
jgi:hypothetical protein